MARMRIAIRTARTVILAFALAALGAALATRAEAAAPCVQKTFEGHRISVCSFDAAKTDIRLFHSDGAGNVLGEFSAVAREAARSGRKLRFAMNAGMYHPDRAPVGLYVEDGRQMRPVVTGRGSGNFSMLPNGVFFIDRNGPAVLETRAYVKRAIKPQFATQSGPMLVLDGRLHYRFRASSDNLKIRNGVGVSRDRKRVWFALSDDPVNFHTFARFFRDSLGARNALYLDGSISRMYAPDIGRNDFGLPMGPIVGALD